MLLHQPKPDVKPMIVDNVVNVELRELAFVDAPLSSVLETVEAVYNVKFEVKNEAVLKKSIDTNFSNDTIDNIVTTLARTMDVSIKEKAPGIYIIE
jgi:transmembrane sensor